MRWPRTQLSPVLPCARLLTPPSSSQEAWLVATVKRQAESGGIGMPEVAIFNSPQVNAFATGMKRNNALVAVSSGLLEAMTREEAEAVVAMRSVMSPTAI